jgi:penicillin amidase
MDIYEEKLDPENTNRYKTPDGWETFSTREEVIYCDGEDKPDTLQILISRHGPVTDMHDSLSRAYALRWAGFDVNLATAIKKAFELPHIADFQNFRQIITGFGALNANWMYADVMGNIGYQLGTPVPVRNWTYDGFRLPGWVSDFEWQGYHPLEDTPHSFNPEQGWLGSCNNRPDSANLNYELPGNYAIDRILRLQELMNSQEKFSVADLVRFQQDRQSAFLMLWRQDLVDALHSAGRNDLADRMTEWDGSMEADSREAALMELWLFHMKQMIFKDEMGELVPQLNRREIFRDRVLYNTYHEPYPIWFDNIETDDVFETRDQIAQLALEKALEETDGGEWGAFQMLNPAHPFSVVPVIGWLLDLEKGPFPRAGSNSTLNASFSIPEKDHFKVLAAPSWRFVIDFNDIDAAKMMAPAGQSGHPLDAHFFDFYDMWESGQMWNVPFSREKVYARSYSVLNLLPLKAE